MYNRQKSSVVDDTDASVYDEKSDVLSHIPDFFDQDEQQQNEKTLDLSISASQSHLKYVANFWDVLSFGICVAAANIFIAWGSGFRQGFWDFFFATVVSSFSFINLFLCIAELVSIVPYGGGAYALARVTAGPYIGFLVGCCESIGNIVFAFVAMLPLGTTITYIFDGDPQYEPLYWLIIYGVVIGAEFAGRKFYFSFLRFVAFLSLSIITLYFIVSFQQINPDKYIPSLIKSTYREGIVDAFPLLMPAGWWYYGIEIMPLINDEVRNAKENSPKAIILTVAIVTFLAFVCIVFAYCQYPSYEDDKVFLLQSLPLNSGFSNAFGITDQMATILSYPGLYISNALFIYGYGKQLRALAKSKLLPSFLSLTLTDSNIPYVALLLGSLIGYIALAVLNKGYGNNYDSPIMVELFNAALMGSYFTFEVMFISFIIFRNRYSNLSRSFTNPLGIYGAIAGMIGFGFLSISLVGYTYDNFHAFYMFLVFITLSSLYYYFYARYNQIFSEEEQAVMFRVYLMKANQRRIQSRLRIKKHHLNGRKFRKQSLRSEDHSIAISLDSGANSYQMVHGRSVSKVHIAPPPLVQSPSILEDELMSVSSPRDLDIEGTSSK